MSKVANKPGADPTLPDVELLLGGKTWHLAYDFNAICVAEQETGVNMLAAVVGEITARSLRGLLWAAVLKDQPDTTIEEIGKLIKPTNITPIRDAVITAWFGSVPDAEADAASGEDQAQGF